jgi:hypothetical protein
MHDCQRFREDWVAGEAEDFGDCGECRSFCEEAQFILRATDGAAQPAPEFSEYYWNRFEGRMRENLLHENAAHTYRVYWKWSAFAAAAAAVVGVLTWGGMRVTQPIVDYVKETPEIEYVDDHIEGLNPTVVEFLGQSELFLRNFSHIEPSYEEDLQDAQSRAKQGLTVIAQQKARTADFEPVLIALDEYENVLREIKNLDSPEELADIQARIRSNGLIAKMGAYQPQVMLVSRR